MTEGLKILIIGIGNRKGLFPNGLKLQDLDNCFYFSGGLRHFDLVRGFLPKKHKWINIDGDLLSLVNSFKQINDKVVVFASGDPWFFGIGNTLRRMLGEVEISSYSYFSSLQILARKFKLKYGEAKMVSLHGRPWKMLDEALIKGEKLIGVLTDQNKNPQTIAKRLLEFNFNNYTMLIGENLEANEERLYSPSLEDASKGDYASLNCLFLKMNVEKPRCLGIPTRKFKLLHNRDNLITKAPIRLSALAQLNLYNATTFWDIGSCTGSIAIEAKSIFPHLKVIAFEKRPECEIILNENIRRLSTPGISIKMGTFPECVTENMPIPESVFIGGHGGKLSEVINFLDKVLNPNSRIVINVVQQETKVEFIKRLKDLNYELLSPICLRVDNFNPIEILTGIKK